MDLGLLFGFLATWALVAWALVSGGNLNYYINWPSVILVVGCTVTVLFMSAPLQQVKMILKVLRKAMFPQRIALEKLIQDMVHYAELARRNGILSLESVTREIDDPFIVRGLQMAIDGTDPELIEQVLNSELDSLAERHENAKALFDIMGKYAPAFGMIGTLVGLVVMLMNMDDPKKIGPGMAVAILTTLYGALIANCFALPLADRLAKRSGEEMLAKTIIIKGIMAIQSGDNPRIVEQKLRSYLPPSLRKAVEKEAA